MLGVGNSREIHAVMKGVAVKCNPNNGYVVLRKLSSFMDFGLLHVKMMPMSVSIQNNV